MSALRLLAHNGGWDEAAFFGVPFLIFAVLAWRANRRAKRAELEREQAAEPEE